VQHAALLEEQHLQDRRRGGLARVDVPGSDMCQGWVMVRAPRLDLLAV